MSNERRAEILKAVSWPELVHKYRHARREGHVVKEIDAITMVGVALIAFLILMYLAITSKDGLSAFVGGMVVGAIGGAVFWSYHQGGRSGKDASSHAAQPNQLGR
jgi:hypothetical protein